jgi:hypothetical protein
MICLRQQAAAKVFHQRIYVLSGKSLKITAKLVTGEPSRGEVQEKP